MSYPIRHISYSCLSLWDNCSWCWRERYINHRKPIESEAFREGKLRHDEVDKYHKGQEYDRELIRPYTDKYEPNYREVSEVKFLMPLFGLAIPFLGYIDGWRNGELVDLKYSKQVPSLKENIQGILYSTVYKHNHGHFPIFTINHWNKITNEVKNHSTVYNNNDVLWLQTKIVKFFSDISGKFDLMGNPYYPFHYDDCPFK